MVSGGSSTLPHFTLFSVATALLIVFTYLKNRLLATIEPGYFPGKEDGLMRKVRTSLKTLAASAAEISVALGVSIVASAGPLA